MTALSKQPGDYLNRIETPTAVETPSVVERPSVGSSKKLLALKRPDLPKDGNPRARLYKAVLVQDAHSLGEQAVYEALWKMGSAGSEPSYRTSSIGYDRLAKTVRLNEKSIRWNIRSLIEKLAIEVMASENSTAKQGKTYRVFGYERILARRKAAGLEWVLKNKGVRFVQPPQETPTVALASRVNLSELITPTVAITPTVIETSTETVVETPTETVGVSTVPSLIREISLEKSFRETSSSLTNASTVLNTANHFGLILDDAAVQKLIRRCQNGDPSSTEEEISHFLELKIRQLRRSPRVENWVGLLISAVPAYFTGTATELARYRTQKAQERADSERSLREVITSADSSEAERQWAREQLGQG